jgi:hypothetical protein
MMANLVQINICKQCSGFSRLEYLGPAADFGIAGKK